MQIGEEKKDGSRSQDLFLHWQAAQSSIHQRSKAQSPSPAPNRNTWHSSTPSRSRSGSSASSKKSAMTSTIRMSSTATTKALSPLRTIPSTMHVQNISTSNIISSETVSKTVQYD